MFVTRYSIYVKKDVAMNECDKCHLEFEEVARHRDFPAEKWYCEECYELMLKKLKIDDTIENKE